MRRAQTILEYAVVIACFIAALVAMQIYIKRGFSGRFRQVADELGGQYSPKHTTSDITTSLSSDVTSALWTVPGIADDGTEGRFAFREDRTNEETTIRKGSEEVEDFSKESLWE